MQQNKSKRVRSAIVLRNPSFSPLGHHRKDTINLGQSYLRAQDSFFFKEINSPEDERIKQKESQFRNTFRSLSKTSPIKPTKSKERFIQYNGQTWRTINTAKSLSRLSNMTKFDPKDPIKINLLQKLQRIKTKHSENQGRQSLKPSSLNNYRMNQKSIQNNNLSNPIANKIQQILGKWQNQKSYSSSVYRRKIQKLSQEFPNKNITKNSKKQSSSIQINWSLN